MPSMRYYNQTAPFWDFIANLENNAGNHPFFSAYNPESQNNQRGANPAGPPPHHHDGPPPPPAEGPPPPSDGHHSHPPHSPHDHPHPPHSPYDHPFGPGFPFGRRHHGNRGGRRGGNPCGAGNLGGGPFGGWGGLANDLDMNKIAEFFASHFNAEDKSDVKNNNANTKDGASKDFSPPADIFDTEEHYVIHISLPGAKKEDVGVNWDADKSELSIAGVIYRPGDEEFLKTLALDERQVGVFERKVRLGSRASPAAVDEDGMSAKMEDGVLIVTIPKKDAGYVEVKKVDIE